MASPFRHAPTHHYVVFGFVITSLFEDESEYPLGRSNHSATPAQPRPIIAMSCCRRRASAAPASLPEPLPACAPQRSPAVVTININVNASAASDAPARVVLAQAPLACAACSLGPEDAPHHVPCAPGMCACARPHARARPARAPASAKAKASACAPRDLTEHVFIAPQHGTKYHKVFACSGAIHEMTLTQASAQGYSPCKKCT